jgi:hypothetical protein
MLRGLNARILTSIRLVTDLRALPLYGRSYASPAQDQLRHEVRRVILSGEPDGTYCREQPRYALGIFDGMRTDA